MAAWIHHTQVRKAEKQEGKRFKWKATTDPENPLKTRLTASDTRIMRTILNLVTMFLFSPFLRENKVSGYRAWDSNHQPYPLTWEIVNLETLEVYNATSKVAPLHTWWPDLYFNLERISPVEEISRTYEGRAQARERMSEYGFYACPGFRTGEVRRKCGGPESFCCAKWECVTTNVGE